MGDCLLGLAGLAGLSRDWWLPKPGHYATLDLRSGGLHDLVPGQLLTMTPGPCPAPLPMVPATAGGRAGRQVLCTVLTCDL